MKPILQYYQRQVEIIICTCLVLYRIKKFPAKEFLDFPPNTIPWYINLITQIKKTSSYYHSCRTQAWSFQVKCKTFSGNQMLSSNTNAFLLCLHPHVSGSHSWFFHVDSMGLDYLSKAKIKFYIRLFCYGDGLLITGASPKALFHNPV